MSKGTSTNTVVIGAGQAGLAVSHLLTEADVAHVVLERGCVGNSWRTQRWDSFRLNTPNRINVLPGAKHAGSDPEGFCSHDELVRYFEAYGERLPIRKGVTVTTVRRAGDRFAVATSAGEFSCSNVVLCTGDQNKARTPEVARHLPKDLVQVHAEAYRRADQLPDGAVLVVGSGQSGVQIVEDLLDAGRGVHLCTSFVARAPRRYRGRDLTDWMQMAGLLEQRPEDLEDPSELGAAQPQISGTRGGHSVSLHLLGRNGATLLGRLEGVRGRVLKIGDDLAANVALGDEKTRELYAKLDMAIEKMGIDAPPAEADPADEPFEGMADMARIREVDLDNAGIRSVVWATGFGAEFGYLDSTWLDEGGYPRHSQGVCDVPGLYCVGMKWLRRRVSGLVAGVADDATYVVGELINRSGSTPS